MTTSPSELRAIMLAYTRAVGVLDDLDDNEYAARHRLLMALTTIELHRLDALTEAKGAAIPTDTKVVVGGRFYVREEMYQSVEAERDEARAKLAEVESSRDAHVNLARAASDASARLDSIRTKLSTELADLRARLTAAESALAGERERAEDARKIALEEASRIWNAIAGDRVRTGVTRIEDEIVAKAYREVAADLMDRSRRRATTGGEQYVPPTRYEKVVNMGPTPTSASGDPPSPAAPDFERRVEALSDDFASGGVNWNSLARRALKAEDEAKRLRDMIAEYVAAKSAGTSGPTSPSAVRLYRAERALKDAAQPEAGR